jgi:hypothetical protein
VQELELDALVDVGHTSLLWRECQAERPDDLLGLGDERLGVVPVTRNADDKIIGLCRVPDYADEVLGSL